MFKVLDTIGDEFLGASTLPVVTIKSNLNINNNQNNPSATPVNPFTFNYQPLEAPQSASSFSIEIKDTSKDGVFTCENGNKDSYMFNGDWKQMPDDCVLESNEAKILFRSLTSTNSDYTEQLRKEQGGAEVTLNFAFQGATSNSVQAPIWIVAKVMIPREDQTNCQNAIPATSQNQPVSITRQTLVRRKTGNDPQENNNQHQATTKAAGPTTTPNTDGCGEHKNGICKLRCESNERPETDPNCVETCCVNKN